MRTIKPVVVRGGGDIATGTIYSLWRVGIPVIVLESTHPSSIRRYVSVSEAVYDGSTHVEDMCAVLVKTPEEALRAAEAPAEGRQIPVLVDPEGSAIRTLSPDIVVDAILAKKNLGTSQDMAPLVIALGPGFTARPRNTVMSQESQCSADECAAKTMSSSTQMRMAEENIRGDAKGLCSSQRAGGGSLGTSAEHPGGSLYVDAVIETMRGHSLGRVITDGSALPNTGVPGVIAGHSADRVIHAQAEGILLTRAAIGDFVHKGDVIAQIREEDGTLVPVRASLTGVLRGILRDGFPVTKGFKTADIDPRAEQVQNCRTISDKARCIGGSVLMLVCRYLTTAQRGQIEKSC